MCLIQIKHAQIKFPLFGFWTVWWLRNRLKLFEQVTLKFLLGEGFF
jgi:hypothetical protein